MTRTEPLVAEPRTWHGARWTSAHASGGPIPLRLAIGVTGGWRATADGLVGLAR
jgi:hypothetical protein